MLSCRRKKIIQHGLQIKKPSATNHPSAYLQQEWDIILCRSSLNLLDLTISEHLHKTHEGETVTEEITNEIIDDIGLAAYFELKVHIHNHVNRLNKVLENCRKKKTGYIFQQSLD